MEAVTPVKCVNMHRQSAVRECEDMKTNPWQQRVPNKTPNKCMQSNNRAEHLTFDLFVITLSLKQCWWMITETRRKAQTKQEANHFNIVRGRGSEGQTEQHKRK